MILQSIYGFMFFIFKQPPLWVLFPECFVSFKFRSHSDFVVVTTDNQTLHSRLNIIENTWYNINTQLNRINDKVLVVCYADVFHMNIFISSSRVYVNSADM